METRLIASAVIEKGGLFLFGRKPKGVGPYPDTWHLLGGKVKEGESLFEAVKREVREESGVELKELKPLGFDEDVTENKHGILTHYVFLVFEASYASGVLKPRDDIVELKWFSKNDLPKAGLNKPTVKLLRKMGLV